MTYDEGLQEYGWYMDDEVPESNFLDGFRDLPPELIDELFN